MRTLVVIDINNFLCASIFLRHFFGGFKLRQRQRFRAVLPVECEYKLVIIQENRVYEYVNDSLAVLLIVYIAVLEFAYLEHYLLFRKRGFLDFLFGDEDFKVRLFCFQFVKTLLDRSIGDAFLNGV